MNLNRVLYRRIREQLPLSRTHAKLFLHLLRFEKIASNKDLADFCGDSFEAMSPHAVGVHIGAMRKLLRPFGIEIENRYSVGYFLPPHSKEQAAILLSQSDAG